MRTFKKFIYLIIFVLALTFLSAAVANQISAKESTSCSHSTKVSVTKATVKKNGKKVTECIKCKSVISSKTIYRASSVKLSSASYVYNGKKITPAVTVKDSKGKKLKEGTDYTLKYESGRKSIGQYTVTVRFKGNYSGKKVLSFSIVPDNVKGLRATQSTSAVTLSWQEVKGASGYRVYFYNAKAEKYVKLADVSKESYTVKKINGKALKAGTDYKFAIRAFKETSDGNIFSAKRKTLMTATDPVKVTLKVTPGSKSAVLKWSKVSCSGYEVVYASNKSFSSAKKITVKKASEVKLKIKNLTKGQVYYFKVRAYKNTDGGKIYGYYSQTKNIKIK